MSSLPPAVILAHGPGGLGATRCLGRRGVDVTAIAFSSDEPVVGSCWAKHTFVLPDGSPNTKESFLLERLLALRDQGTALLATSDRTVAFLARHRHMLTRLGYRSCISSDDLIAKLNDKVAETRLIASLGVAIPKTVFPLPASAAELVDELGSDVIFKPRNFEVSPQFERKRLVARTRADVEAIYARYENRLPLLLAQEIVPGEDHAGWVVSASFGRDSQMLACAVKRKLRMSPPHFGASTLAVSEWNGELVDVTRRLAAALEYTGHANFEFRRDARDGRYRYIEMNPRIQANVEFDSACGVPTVWISYLAAIGRDATGSCSQRDGVFFVDLWQDARARLTAHEQPMHAMSHYLTLAMRPRAGQYFVWDDPFPGLHPFRRFLRQKLVTYRSSLKSIPAFAPASRR